MLDLCPVPTIKKEMEKERKGEGGRKEKKNERKNNMILTNFNTSMLL